LVVIEPEHAAIIAKSGFSKKQVKRFLHKRTRISKELFSRKHQEDQFSKFDVDPLISVTPKGEDFMIIVPGGAGKHSDYCQGFAFTYSVTKEISECP